MSQAATQTITGVHRTVLGKGSARAARRAGWIPCVVYGGEAPPLHIALEARALSRLIHRSTFMSAPTHLDLDDGQKLEVLARDIQSGPLSGKTQHVDFLRVTKATRLSVPVGVVFLNQDESPGLKQGGILNVVRHEVVLVGSIRAMPKQLEFDLSGAQIGDTLKSDALDLPPGIVPEISDRAFVIANIAPPRVDTVASTTSDESIAEDEQPADQAG